MYGREKKGRDVRGHSRSDLVKVVAEGLGRSLDFWHRPGGMKDVSFICFR